MKSSALDEYRAMMNELLFARELEGGELPEERESWYVERLDVLWWRLSTSEQEAYERELEEQGPRSSPVTLDLVDCEVGDGDSAPPRKAA